MDGYTKWKYVNGRFVTGRESQDGSFVDVRLGKIGFSRDARGNIWAILVPATEAEIDLEFLPATIINVVSITPRKKRVTEVEVTFRGETIQLYVGHCLFDTPELEKVSYVTSFEKIAGYVVLILFAILTCKILHIQLSDLDIAIVLVIYTIVYFVTIGFREKSS